MRWEDERYVRFYTRDTAEWLALSWHARGLFGLVLRAVDRAGVLPVGKLGQKGLAVAIQAPWVEVESPLAELLEDGCVVWDEARAAFLIPNYLEAQECPQSDAARKRASREKARAQFGGGSEASEKARTALKSQTVTAEMAPSQIVTDPPPVDERRTAASGPIPIDTARKSATADVSMSQTVTAHGHETGQNVTNGHARSRAVTPYLPVPSVPSLSVPNQDLEAKASQGVAIATAAAPQEPVAPTAAVWASYSSAYEKRYGEKPVRNAMVNGQLANFISRVPRAEAPEIAAFYVSHRSAYYVRDGHSVGLLVKHAEKLRTEWARGVQITDTRARQEDRTATNVEGWSELLRGNGHVD
jgi:hypothetical protein